jgi:hypothetical protein
MTACGTSESTSRGGRHGTNAVGGQPPGTPARGRVRLRDLRLSAGASDAGRPAVLRRSREDPGSARPAVHGQNISTFEQGRLQASHDLGLVTLPLSICLMSILLPFAQRLTASPGDLRPCDASSYVPYRPPRSRWNCEKLRQRCAWHIGVRPSRRSGRPWRLAGRHGLAMVDPKGLGVVHNARENAGRHDRSGPRRAVEATCVSSTSTISPMR